MCIICIYFHAVPYFNWLQYRHLLRGTFLKKMKPRKEKLIWYLWQYSVLDSCPSFALFPILRLQLIFIREDNFFMLFSFNSGEDKVFISHYRAAKHNWNQYNSCQHLMSTEKAKAYLSLHMANWSPERTSDSREEIWLSDSQARQPTLLRTYKRIFPLSC